MDGSPTDLARPKVSPPLDPDFRPAVLTTQHQKQSYTLGVWRGDELVATHKTPVTQNLHFVERTIKFLLWQVGGDRITISGYDSAIPYLQSCYSTEGTRKFDVEIVGQKMFDSQIVIEKAQQGRDSPKVDRKRIGRNLDGCRVGFDLGASDRKVAAVIDGETVFAEEVVWDPRGNSDPAYHKKELVTAIRTAMSHMPHLNAIGGSTAGVVIDNRMRVSSLFRGVSDTDYPKARDIFLNIQKEFGVPLEVANDGDVTALAGSMSLGTGRLLGIAMGSSLAGGYVDSNGDVTGWINELAFTPIDFSPSAPADEWSGDIGCGVQYLTQQAVFRLAKHVGIDLSKTEVLAEKLKIVQNLLESGHTQAELIWKTIGVYFGYALAHYDSFYDLDNVLLLGRVASGKGGQIIVDQVNEVLKAEFPEIHRRLNLLLPDEKTRRVGQAVAAASLPRIK